MTMIKDDKASYRIKVKSIKIHENGDITLHTEAVIETITVTLTFESEKDRKEAEQLLEAPYK